MPRNPSDATAQIMCIVTLSEYPSPENPQVVTYYFLLFWHHLFLV